MDGDLEGEALLAALQSPTVPVSIGGVAMHVKRISWALGARLRREFPDDDSERTQARLMTAAICDADGRPKLDPRNESHVDGVENAGADFVNAVAPLAARFDSGKDSAQTTSS